VKRRLAIIGLALVTLGATLLSSPAPAGAASITKAAWWSKARTGDPSTLAPPEAGPLPGGIPTAPAPPTPGPPTVPDGSLLVEGTARGADAIAAITYTMTTTESAPTLTITPSATSQVPEGSIILACHAAVDWSAPDQNPGAWEDKPLVACDQSVQGIAADDGTITFALAPLCQQCTTLDVVLVPGTVAAPTDGTAPPVGSTFSLSFDAETGAKLVTTASSDSSASDSSSFAPDSSATATLGTTYGAPTSSFAAPTPIAQPALEPQEQAPTVPQQTALPIAAPVKDDRTARGVGFLILLAGLAFGGLAYATPARSDDGLVGLGRFRKPAPADAGEQLEPVNGGLGRFTRPRSGPPPALS
jgi:hypothetical protein